MLLFAAFTPQFLSSDPAGTTAAQLALLRFAYIGIEAVSALGYTVLGGRLGTFEFTRRAPRRLDQITGASFLGLAGFLTAEHRP